MLEDGVAERIKTLLRSDMPPVQFKLLGTLRMLVDGQGDINMARNMGGHKLWKSSKMDFKYCFCYNIDNTFYSFK